MTLASVATGTKTTDGTEQSLASWTSGKTCVLLLDLTTMAGGTTPDVLQVVAYVKVLSGSTKAKFLDVQYVGGLIPANVVISVPVPALHYGEFTIKELQGAHNDIDWEILSID